MTTLINRIFGKKEKRLTFEEFGSFLENFGIELISFEESFRGVEFPRAYCFHMEFSEINARPIKNPRLIKNIYSNPANIEISGIYHSHSSSTNPYSPNFPNPISSRFYRKYPFSIFDGRLNLKRK